MAGRRLYGLWSESQLWYRPGGVLWTATTLREAKAMWLCTTADTGGWWMIAAIGADGRPEEEDAEGQGDE